MMKRITISIDEDFESFLKEKSEEYGNRSRVIREALERMRKQEMIEEMQSYFRDEPDGEDASHLDNEQAEAWADLPDY